MLQPATISLITRKVLKCDMKFCYKNIFKIRHESLIFHNKIKIKA